MEKGKATGPQKKKKAAAPPPEQVEDDGSMVINTDTDERSVMRGKYTSVTQRIDEEAEKLSEAVANYPLASRRSLLRTIDNTLLNRLRALEAKMVEARLEADQLLDDLA